MQSYVTIPVTVDELEIVHEDGREAPRLRFGRLRIFMLSVILGLSIGATVSFFQPEQSLRASLATRHWLMTTFIEAQAWVAEVRAR
jgi:hypothetical protein